MPSGAIFSEQKLQQTTKLQHKLKEEQLMAQILGEIVTERVEEATKAGDALLEATKQADQQQLAVAVAAYEGSKAEADRFKARAAEQEKVVAGLTAEIEALNSPQMPLPDALKVVKKQRKD
ncbi:hypothetical protein LTR84_011275 [Exophiala bonariae]|uniref:ATP synthase subunit 4, mitochondrial n=1 Tax=Exophiala bonariae TaxID=1690606 RepID=A0AAV9MUZ2_9EURO|nr:hypothetical protein LTR84_011275 [Exophiala bonariae]